MIKAELRGRRLVLTVEDEDGGAIIEPYVVEPLSAKTGRELSSRYVFAIEGLPPLDPNAPTVADDMVSALGKANYERADNELHLGEIELIAQAAYFWQTVGGMDAVRELLTAHPDDGTQGGPVARGKAQAAFLLRVVPLLQQIRHSLESARQMRTAATPATDSPKAGEPSESDSTSSPSNAQPSPTPGSTPTQDSAPSPATTD